MKEKFLCIEKYLCTDDEGGSDLKFLKPVHLKVLLSDLATDFHVLSIRRIGSNQRKESNIG